MTIFLYLDVPYFERKKAYNLGADWCPRAKMWYCNKTQWRSAAFKRWRDQRAWRRVKVYPDETPDGIAAAKERGCLWDKDSKTWFVEITGDDSLTKWFRARSAPPPVHELNVSFEEREEAKRIGCRWSPESKCWVLRTRGQLCEWAAKRVKPQAPAVGA